MVMGTGIKMMMRTRKRMVVGTAIKMQLRIAVTIIGSYEISDDAH